MKASEVQEHISSWRIVKLSYWRFRNRWGIFVCHYDLRGDVGVNSTKAKQVCVCVCMCMCVCVYICEYIYIYIVAQLCLTFCDPKDFSLPRSSVHGDSLGNNTGMGCHALLQKIFPTQRFNSGLLHCRWILYPLRHQWSPWILEWVPYPFSRASSQPRSRTRVSCIAGRFFTSWATREAQGG